MDLEIGDRVAAESETTERPARKGTVEERLGDGSPRYRIRWDDGHESIYTPAAGSLQRLRETQPETSSSRG